MTSPLLTLVAAFSAVSGIFLVTLAPRRHSAHRESSLKRYWAQCRTRFNDITAVSGTRIGLEQFLALSLLAGVSAGICLTLVTGLVMVGWLAGLLAAYLPFLGLQSKLHSVQGQRGKAWPNLADNLVSGVRAGLSLGETLLEVAARAPKSLRVPFAHFAADYRAGGNLDASLKILKHELADPVGDRIVEALRLAAQVGGNDLVVLLEDLGAMLRAEERTRGEVLARQSWTVTGARLAAASPWIILALLLSRPGTLEVYSTSVGSMILLVGALVSALAYILMLRLGRLEVSPRTMRE
ncbi:type II secretion system F family protein [Mobiluncus sp.]|uniref:type II secretion system F family protein n=1 Tax=Mobiluncus sp. TaxID=47293 RepID=UPI002A91346B|nr:type II secretion system F family protein [Mobiluncus sp.]MDY6077170.1 type II secretion system F family protein [Mobiluncus sp.]